MQYQLVVGTKANRRLPVDHWPLSDLYGAEFLVVCAWQVETALLPVAPRAA